MKTKLVFCFFLYLLTTPSLSLAMDLFDAVSQANLEVVRHRIEQGDDVNETDQWGDTPLHVIAGERGDYSEIARLLINDGARVNAKNWSGETPLHLAAGSGSAKTVKLLIQAKADPNIQVYSDPAAHAYGVICRLISSYISQISLNQREVSLQTPLHYALHVGWPGAPMHVSNREVCKMLIFAGANPDLKNYHGYIPRKCPQIADLVQEFEDLKRSRQEMHEFIKTQCRPSIVPHLPQHLLIHIYEYIKDPSKG